MIIQKIAETDFAETFFEKKIDFQLNQDFYNLEVIRELEIGMSNYEIEIVITKNGNIEFQKTGSLPEYWQFISSNKNIIAIPYKNGVELIDLRNNLVHFFERDSNCIIGNQFSLDGNFMIVIHDKELNLISIQDMKNKFRLKDKSIYFTQGKFDGNNNLWLIEDYYNKKRVEIINPNTLKSNYHKIPSPFNFFEIDKNKYKEFLESKSYNLKIDNSDGLFNLDLLNKWLFIPTKAEMIYKAIIPTSIKKSELYGGMCLGKTEYIKLVKK